MIKRFIYLILYDPFISFIEGYIFALIIVLVLLHLGAL